MTPIKHLTGPCAHCGVPIRYPATSIGQVAPCPHCGQPTELVLGLPETQTTGLSKPILWSVVGILILLLSLAVTLVGLKHYQNKLADRQKPAPSENPE